MDDATKTKVRELVEGAFARLEELNLNPEEVAGIAFYDARKDEIFTELREFGRAVDALRSEPTIQERFGESEAERLALQFIYAMNKPASPGTWAESRADMGGA